MQRLTRPLSAVLLLCVIGPTTASAEKGKPPNVVMIISDDQAWTDYGFMGHRAIRTPSLDRLARQSALFTRGYVPTALCRPSLATIITGLYAHQHKISGNDPARRGAADFRRRRERLIAHIDLVDTLPRLLAGRGFVSHQSGKWWEGNHRRGGFTHGMTRGFPQPGGRHGDDGLSIGRQGLKPVLDFIDAAGEKPFFLWYAPFLPHQPHNPPERLLRKYRTPDRPPALAKYYAMCEWFDQSCGELLDHLDKRQLSRNTLVLYVCDNGWIQRTRASKTPKRWRYRFGPRSKQSPYEGGVRTPIMIRWPGHLKPMRDEKTLVSSIDLAPTVLAACRLKPGTNMQGINLLDVCSGKAPRRDAIFGETFAHDVADIDRPAASLAYRWCIEKKWKLIAGANGKLGRYADVHQGNPKRPQLFDLISDPHERSNVAAKHPEIVKRLTMRLDAWWTGGE